MEDVYEGIISIRRMTIKKEILKMYKIACEIGNLLNGMFNYIEANSFMVPCRTYGYVVAVILGLSLLGAIDKAVYSEVKVK